MRRNKSLIIVTDQRIGRPLAFEDMADLRRTCISRRWSENEVVDFLENSAEIFQARKVAAVGRFGSRYSCSDGKEFFVYRSGFVCELRGDDHAN